MAPNVWNKFYSDTCKHIMMFKFMFFNFERYIYGSISIYNEIWKCSKTKTWSKIWLVCFRKQTCQSKTDKYKIKLEQWKSRYQIWCARRVSGITFIGYAQIQTFWQPNNLNVFASKKTKWLKQNSNNRQRSLMPEGGEPCAYPSNRDLIAVYHRTLTL